MCVFDVDVMKTQHRQVYDPNVCRFPTIVIVDMLRDMSHTIDRRQFVNPGTILVHER